MTFTLVNLCAILVWFHMFRNNADRYGLQALNLQRFPFLLKRNSSSQWRDGGSGGCNGSPTTATTTKSTPRKYRHLDVQEEYARDRCGVHDHYLPHQWFDRITQTLNQQHRNEGDIAKINKVKSLTQISVEASHSPRQMHQLKIDDSTTSIPLLDSLLRKKNHQQIVANVNELRHKILDESLALQNVKIECPYVSANAAIGDVLQHDVIQVIVSRYHSQSKPGQRYSNDTAYLALAIEGGGVRGAVCSGMAAAIATLGLTDSFDTVIGSSAGSVIGAYMVSRQMCVDVYLDILPAAKRLFACTKRLLHSISVTALDVSLTNLLKGRLRTQWKQLILPKGAPGMNTSFILDGIMNDRRGLRPLDMNSFRTNDQRQPLRVASSYVQNGRLYTKCFGTEHFFTDSNTTNDSFVRRLDGRRNGLFACLEASMTVPGATGDPVRIADSSADHGIPFFDAFCFEPLPYRSAVDVGATHVLVLCSRPEGFQPKTIPGMYENGIANMYFKAHNEPEVAEFFERGGQQYIYAEDLLTLEEGKLHGINQGSAVHVPPPVVLYGVNRDEVTDNLALNRDQWKKAYLLPLKVPIGTKELPSLEQNRDAVGDAVRGGFAAAFDLLAPAIGLQLDHNLTGVDVAKLLFPPDVVVNEFVLQHQLHVRGEYIPARSDTSYKKNQGSHNGRTFRRKTAHDRINPLFGDIHRSKHEIGTRDRKNRAEYLLQVLPGFASGRMQHLAIGLKTSTA